MCRMMLVAAAVLAVCVWAEGTAVQLHHVQGAGLHNAYHRVPQPTLPQWNISKSFGLGEVSGPAVRATHVELDVWPGPEFPVGHVPTFDNSSSCNTLAACLANVAASVPPVGVVTVLIELKGGSAVWSTGLVDAVASTVASALGSLVVSGPDLLAAAHTDGARPATLAEMARMHAWPRLHGLAGRVLTLVMDTDGAMAAAVGPTSWPPILLRMTSLEVANSTDGSDVAFVKIDTPDAAGLASIDAAVRAGYMVRTRADAEYLPFAGSMTDMDVVAAFFAVLDRDGSGTVTTGETIALLAATGLDSAAAQSLVGAAAASCGDLGSGVDVAGLACEALFVASNGFPLIPPAAALVTSRAAADARLAAAVSSGAHFVSSDYLEPQATPSAYRVSFHRSDYGGYVCNPVTAGSDCTTPAVNAAARGACPPHCASCTHVNNCTVCDDGYVLSGMPEDPLSGISACVPPTNTTAPPRPTPETTSSGLINNVGLGIGLLLVSTLFVAAVLYAVKPREGASLCSVV